MKAARDSIQQTPRPEETEEQQIVADLEDSIQTTLGGLAANPGEKDDVPITIFLAPSFVRETQPNYYKPTVLSIGPYHWKLEAMKRLFLGDLMSRVQEDAQNKSLKECVQVIMPLEPRARSCYMDALGIRSINRSHLVKMLLMDGCFITELLYKCLFQDSGSMLPWSCRSTMWTDLLKLENQIPFFVLEALFKLPSFQIIQTKHPRLALLNLLMEREDLLRFIVVDGLESNVTECSFIPFRTLWSIRDVEVHHLLHLYYLYLTPKPQESYGILGYTSATLASPIHFLRILADIIMILIFSPHRLLKYIFTKERLLRNIIIEASSHICAPAWLKYFSMEAYEERYPEANFRSATQLEDCGVAFTKRKEWNSLCDATFSRFRGIMQIPRLNIDRETRTRFANLIAYEQHLKGQSKYMLSFAFLMDRLISSPKDVALLREREIIVSNLEDKELADFFNNICRGFDLTSKDYYFRELSNEVAEYCKFKLLKGRVYLKMLKRDYFSSPWALFSFLAGATLLGLTTAQTIFAAYSYYHRRS